METTKTRCTPGDLAVVIRADFETNLGRIVRVIAPDVGESFIRFEGRGEVWWVTCPSLMTWESGNQTYRRKAGPVPDECLMPIRGAPDNAIADERLEALSHEVESKAPQAALQHENTLQNG